MFVHDKSKYYSLFEELILKSLRDADKKKDASISADSEPRIEPGTS
jgi:hypothetical protein